MPPYYELEQDELVRIYHSLQKQYEAYCHRNLKLDMSRGKPGADQLDLCGAMMNCLAKDDYMSSNNIDCRNYGGVDGIPEMKQLFADILDIDRDEVVVGGNSSLKMMFDNIAVNVSHGVRDGVPWQQQGTIKFICPVPGYDRHFSICQYFHIEMIPVEMTPDGPDMDTVERLVASDPLIKGMWCVPVFSNPDGYVYSDEVVRRIANLKPAAVDFRIYWDNSYTIHHFSGERPVIPNILRECEKAGNPNMPLIFTSFSKISFPGAAVAAIASSKSNCDFIRKRLTIQTIGPDKLNQLRHVRFFKDLNGVLAHMEKMAEILRPKFEVVLGTLQTELSGKGVATWTTPSGGYFVSLNTEEGCAKRTVALCKDAGIVMTGAGATFPYGKDPLDRNIRIAPSFPPIAELKTAMEVFCVCVQIAAIEKLLNLKSL